MLSTVSLYHELYSMFYIKIPCLSSALIFIMQPYLTHIKSCTSCMWCVCELGPKERKIYFRENWLKFWGIWGAAELILGIWGA